MKLQRGLSLVQLLVVVSIVGTLGSLAVPPYRTYTERARVAQAIGELGALEIAIRQHALANDRVLPATLADLDVGVAVGQDPWGNDYRYVILDGANPPRVDHAGDPINTDYDLSSAGRDGATALSLLAAESEDDIVRGNNGAFLGLVEDYQRLP